MSEILSSPLFLLGTVVSIALALLFVLFPFFRGGSTQSRLARRRWALQELRYELGPEDYQKRLAKLEQQRVEAGTSATSLRSLTGLLAVSVPLLVLFLYTQVGTPEGINPEPGQSAELRKLLGELTDRVRNQPQDIDAWNRLGMIWKQLQQYPAAEGAFRRVIYIEPENEFARVELAETLLYASNRPQLPEASRELLDSVLAENPDNQKALWLAGLGAFHDGNDARALALWTHLQELLPPGNVRDRIREQIAGLTGGSAPAAAAQTAPSAMVNPHAGMPPDRGARPATSSADDQANAELEGASIQVEVSVAPSLSGRLTGSETVFVFARAVSGPPAPLAVKRMASSKLPAKVTLSDSDSMVQGLSLSTFPQVQISARISRSGNAIASAGDLQGQSGPIAIGDTDQISITIDEVIE